MTEPRWRPMSEAPKDGRIVQMVDSMGNIFHGYWWSGAKEWREPWRVEGIHSLAWQPLPEPPTDEEMEKLK